MLPVFYFRKNIFIHTKQIEMKLKDLLKKDNSKKLNEAKIAKLDDKVASLYAWAGINTKYSDDSVKRFGQAVIDRAIEMTPKVSAYRKKLKQISKDIQDSDEGKILIAMIGHGKGYGGSYNQSSNVGDLFNESKSTKLNEAGLASYYNRAEAPVKSAAKKVDQMLNDLIKDKGQMAKLIDAITDLADEYAQERIDNLDSERN